MTLKVVHLSLTPLAGAPIRLVQALRKFAGIDARLINFNPNAYGSRIFDEDIRFESTVSESREIIESADLVHLHHWIDLRKNSFGVDLTSKKVVRHFHSEPSFVSKHSGVSVDVIVNDPVPQVVVAQFQERYYPNARPVPNLLNLQVLRDVEAKESKVPKNETLTVSYSPTTLTSSFDDRWNTKGAPETIKLIENFALKHAFCFDVFTDAPHARSLAKKYQSDIVIDELVTGSYHLSGLEALAFGKPTFGYLDQRVISVLSAITSSTSLPWINVPLHRIQDCFLNFLESEELRSMAGQASRLWIEEFWTEARLVAFYLRAYEDVLNGRSILRDRPVMGLTDIAIPDYTWRNNIKDLSNFLERLT